MIRWSEVVIHHSGTRDGVVLDLAAIRRYHISPRPEGRGWLDIGYHFVCELIGSTYEIVAGRPLDMIGAHAPGHNATAIGFCLVGDFTLAEPPVEQTRVAARHLRALLEEFSIRRDSVLLHREVRTTDCPGARFTRALLEARFL